MKSLAALTLGTGLLASSAFGAVSFNLYVDAISQSDGTTLISDSGLLVLVVDTGGDGFGLPSDGAIVSGNDEIVTYWDLAEEGVGDAYISLASDLIDWGTGWNVGDDLALFWFPDLDKDNMVPGADTAYGVFSDAGGLTSGDGWMLPDDGEIMHRLAMFTSAATKFAMYSSLPADLGVTSYAVNNAPSTSAPSVPSVDVVNAGGKSTLTWAAGSGANGYIVQRSKNGGDWETIGFASASDPSFEDTDVAPGREYDYRVYSVSAFGAALQDSLDPLTSERSVFKAIASRASLVATPPTGYTDWGLINAGVRLAGNDQYKKVLALGLGPHYNAAENSTSWVDDTTISYNIFGDPTPIASNDNWMEDIENPSQVDPDAEAALVTMGEVGSPVLQTDSLDSFILEDVPVNTGNLFKVRSNGSDGSVGVQLYDAEYEGEEGPTIHDNRFVSISSRGYLADGGRFNGTVVIRGNVPKEVLAVARGPQLVYTGTNQDAVLEDPVISLRAFGIGEVATNDDWDTQIAASDPENGLLSVETDMTRLERVLTAKGVDVTQMTKDSAILVTLNPGSYNFRVLANDGSKADGSVIIEVIEVEID